MRKLFITIIIFFLVITVGLVFFVRSGFFLNIITDYTGSRINQPVRIGSIHLENGNRIIVRDLTVLETEESDPRIILPETEISISFSGIMKRMIDELIITNPELLLPIQSKETDEPSLDKMSLPIDFKKASIKDGMVIIRPEGDKGITINNVQVSLQMQEKEGASKLKASAVVPGFMSNAAVDATVDVRNFDVPDATIKLTETHLGALYGAVSPEKTDASLSGIADITFRLAKGKEDSGRTFIWETKVSASDLFVQAGTVRLNLRSTSAGLASEGVFRSDKNSIEVISSEIQIGDLAPLQLRGALNNVLSDNPDMAIVLTTEEMSLHDAFKIVSGPSVDWLNTMDFRATASVKLEVSGNRGAPVLSAMADVEGEYLKTDSVKIAGFETTLPIDYRDDQFTVHASTLNVMEGSFLDAGKDHLLSVHGLQANIPRLEYKKGSIRSDFFQIKAENAVVSSSGRDVLSEDNILLKGMVDSDLNRPRVMLKDLSLDGDSIKGIGGSVSIHQDKNTMLKANLSWNDINVKELGQKALASVLKEEGLSIHGGGRVQTTFTMSEGEKGKPHLSGDIRMSLTDAGYSSDDETNIGEGIQGELSGKYEIPLPVARIDFTVQTRLSDFELLSGTFYGNFKNRQLSFAAEASYSTSLSEYIVARSEAGLSGIGKILFSGKASLKNRSPFIDGEIQIEDIANHEAFSFLVRETYRERFPFLSDVEIQGMTSGRFSVRGSPDRYTVQGNMNIRDMNITSREHNRSLTGIHITLPVDLSYPTAGEIARDGTYGSVRVKDVLWGDINLKDMEFFPAIRQNALIFREDVSIRLFGGDIVLKDIVYSDLLSPERSVSLSVNVTNISLAEAGPALDMPEFSGTLSGTIPKALFSKGRLSTDGEIVLELFDGKMWIRDLSADNLFSPIASIKSGIQIDGIHLGKLTGAFDFGHISGVLSGRITDLVIVNGQAQSFTARIGTVKKKGVDQKISVEALKKISILGTGSSTSLLDRGIYRFFKEYRYEKIGFSASLNNDNLLLLGLESTGKVGYLVKGGFLPPKVDVINYTQNISFKEMVKRLQRIGQVQQ
ncbi:MAG: hypothetical protein JSW20_02405 [Nitrospiraceae bacterium]|nr:MAG: hypothetical protein JSW20_02405 [Nitrospiraceae bacterium]